MSSIFSMIKKGIIYLKVNGFSQTYKKVKHYLKYTRINTLSFNQSYEKWMKALEETVPPKFLEVNRKAFDLGYHLSI